MLRCQATAAADAEAVLAERRAAALSAAAAAGNPPLPAHAGLNPLLPPPPPWFGNPRECYWCGCGAEPGWLGGLSNERCARQGAPRACSVAWPAPLPCGLSLCLWSLRPAPFLLRLLFAVPLPCVPPWPREPSPGDPPPSPLPPAAEAEDLHPYDAGMMGVHGLGMMGPVALDDFEDEEVRRACWLCGPHLRMGQGEEQGFDKGSQTLGTSPRRRARRRPGARAPRLSCAPQRAPKRCAVAPCHPTRPPPFPPSSFPCSGRRVCRRRRVDV